MRNDRVSGKSLRIAILIGLVSWTASAVSAKPLKVFILAGQSNMQGHVNVSTFDAMADDPNTAPILKEMRKPDGSFVVLDNVWISSIGCAGDDTTEQTGKLTAGFGARKTDIGPEFTFGIYMEKALHEPILLIKTSWGGKSLHTDFRPPSAGPETFNDTIISKWKQKGLDVDQESEKIRKTDGVYYRMMIDHVHKVLADIKRVVPDYDPSQGYEVAGFVWFQGFNDLVDSSYYSNRMEPGGYDIYGQLMADFIRDVRKDVSAPKMPFVIGVLGVGGLQAASKPPTQIFQQAQASPASLPEFAGTVTAVPTAPFWDEKLSALQEKMEKINRKIGQDEKKNTGTPRQEKLAAREKALADNFTPEELKELKGVSNGGYHYLGAAKIVAPIGKAFAEAMVKLQTSDASGK